MTNEESALLGIVRMMPVNIGVIYIESFQQEHGPFSDDAAEIIREYMSKSDTQSQFLYLK
jgi:hypothetical protein